MQFNIRRDVRASLFATTRDGTRRSSSNGVLLDKSERAVCARVPLLVVGGQQNLTRSTNPWISEACLNKSARQRGSFAQETAGDAMVPTTSFFLLRTVYHEKCDGVEMGMMGSAMV